MLIAATTRLVESEIELRCTGNRFLPLHLRSNLIPDFFNSLPFALGAIVFLLFLAIGKLVIRLSEFSSAANVRSTLLLRTVWRPAFSAHVATRSIPGASIFSSMIDCLGFFRNSIWTVNPEKHQILQKRPDRLRRSRFSSAFC